MIRIWPALLPVALLLLAAALRLTSLADAGIYADEGTQLAIAQSFAATGRFQYLVIQDSTLLFAKFPLFPALLAAWWRAAGVDLASSDALFLSRYLVFALQLLSIALLWQILRRGGASLALAALAALAALLLAVSPRALALAPYAFSYQLAATLALAMWWGVREYRRGAGANRRWLLLAAAAMAAAMLTDLLAWSLLPGLVYFCARRRRRAGLLALAIALMPSLLFLAWSALQAPDATRYDLAALWHRLLSAPLSAQLANLSANIGNLWRADLWLICCLPGAFLLPRPLRAEMLWFVGIPLLAAARTVALSGLGAYHLLLFIPGLVALAAALFWQLLRAPAKARFQTRWRIAIFLPLILFAWLRVAAPNALTTVSIPIAEARETQEFLTVRRAPTELVLASPALAWLLPGTVADFQMALAAERLASAHLPLDLPADRFASESGFAAARYAIIDRYLYRWALQRMPALARQVAEIEAEWQRVFSTGETMIYRRPP